MGTFDIQRAVDEVVANYAWEDALEPWQRRSLDRACKTAEYMLKRPVDRREMAFYAGFVEDPPER